MQEGVCCKECGHDLSDRKAGTEYCDSTCRMRYTRKHEKEHIKGVIKHNIKHNTEQKRGIEHITEHVTEHKIEHKENIEHKKESAIKHKPIESSDTFNYYKDCLEDLTQTHELLKEAHKTTVDELRDQIKSQMSEIKILEEENYKFSVELATINDKHDLEKRQTAIASANTLGGVLKEVGKPESLKLLTGVLEFVKDIKASKKENEKLMPMLSSGNPQKDAIINTIAKVCHTKDIVFVKKYATVLQHSLHSNLLDTNLILIKRLEDEKKNKV